MTAACRHCGAALDRPGDYCLLCHTANADTVVLDLDRDRGTVVAMRDEEVVGRRTVTTSRLADPERERTELRNFAGRVADETRRKRPDAVYAAGDRDVLAAVRADLRYQLYRVRDEDPVEAVRERGAGRGLEVVDVPPAEKLGGSHSTLVGGRDGMAAIQVVADHPNVKKVVPGPIDAGGSGSRSGLRAKATRAGENGNVRLLVRDGSSVQENRVVTTAGDRERGEDVRADLNEALAEAGLQAE